MTGSPGRRILRLALAVLAGLLVVGCSMTLSLEPTPSATPTTAPTLTPRPTVTPAHERTPGEDWMEYQLAEEGFALALPRSWHLVNLGANPPAGILQTLNTSRPRPAQALEPGNPDMRFFAVDQSPESTAGGFMANLNILHRHLSVPETLAEFGAGNAREVGKMPELLTAVQQENVLLPAGPALCLRYQLAVNGKEGQDNRLSLTQFLLVNKQEGYVLTFATMPAQTEHYAPVFGEIGRSLRWLD